MTASCQFDTIDVDNVNIADFDHEIQELGSNVEKIVERIINLSDTADMSSDDIDYMYDVLTQKVKNYIHKED